MNKLKKLILAAILTVLPTVGLTSTVSFVVDAKEHSSNTMNGLATGLIFEEGDGFVAWTDQDDTWFLAGMTTEYTNADGLANYPLYPQNNLTALYGTLVGRIGEGGFFEIGTSFVGEAANDGELFLFNWDAGESGNLDTITVTVLYEGSPQPAHTSATVVPIPASGWMLMAAMAGLGVSRRRS